MNPVLRMDPNAEFIRLGFRFDFHLGRTRPCAMAQSFAWNFVGGAVVIRRSLLSCSGTDNFGPKSQLAFADDYNQAFCEWAQEQAPCSGKTEKIFT